MDKKFHFPKKLKISPVGTNGDWELNEQFYYIRVKKPHIAVPKGFITNFASVPTIFRSIMSPWGNHGKAAVVHDYLYSIPTYTRKQADKIFLEALKVSGVGWFKRHSLYRLVRLFGASHYKGKP